MDYYKELAQKAVNAKICVHEDRIKIPKYNGN